jgi:hypothetical protein
VCTFSMYTYVIYSLIHMHDQLVTFVLPCIYVLFINNTKCTCLAYARTCRSMYMLFIARSICVINWLWSFFVIRTNLTPKQLYNILLTLHHYIYICIFLCFCIHIYACTYRNIYIYMYSCVYIYISVYILVYLCFYILISIFILCAPLHIGISICIGIRKDMIMYLDT